MLLLDDVLYTGRTIRAVLNELFDFGRPASVTLAVLVDRGGRELPIEAAYSAARIALPRSQRLSAQGATLARSDTCTAARGSSATKLPPAPRDSSQPSDASNS